MIVKKNPNYLKYLQIFIFFAVIVSLILFVNHHRKDFVFLANIKPLYLVIVALLSANSLLLFTIQFYFIFNMFTTNLKFKDCFIYFTVGRFLNKIIPYGGGVYRAVLLKKHFKLKYKDYIASFLFSNWLNGVFSLLCAIIIAASLNFLKVSENPMLLFLGGFFILYLLAYPVPKGMLRLFPWFKKFGPLAKLSEAGDIFKSITHILKNRRILLISVTTTAALCLNFGLIFHFCALSINTPLPIDMLALLVVTITIGLLIKITPANLGINEAIFAYMAQTQGYSLAQGLSLSLIIRIFAFLLQGLLSVYFLVGDRKIGLLIFQNPKRFPDE
ncbi:MAG: flippase-like domain-containing protein [Candidatus Aminicenantes bacterium]|nr:flippase-like domain-containing protein [Candidatus Aminicenantes bacterium]